MAGIMNYYCVHATVATLLNSPVTINLFLDRGFRLSYPSV